MRFTATSTPTSRRQSPICRPFPYGFSGALFLGNGAALAVDCPGLPRLHRKLQAAWHDRLTQQDRQKLRPHVTVQNKVAPDVARRTADALRQMAPMEGAAEGLILWRYLGGPWQEIGRYPFAGGIE